MPLKQICCREKQSCQLKINVLLQVNTESGFLTNQTKNPNIIGEVEPYQFNPQLRPESTLRFYRNLDLESCLWEFVSYYDMSELISDCGGDINTDGQVRIVY